MYLQYSIHAPIHTTLCVRVLSLPFQPTYACPSCPDFPARFGTIVIVSLSVGDELNKQTDLRLIHFHITTTQGMTFVFHECTHYEWKWMYKGTIMTTLEYRE